MVSSQQDQKEQTPLPMPPPDEAAMTHGLAQDRPTIDAAVKSFMSLVCARALTASVTDATPQGTATTMLGIINPQATESDDKNPNSQQQDVLQMARTILQSINSYEFAVHKTVAKDLRNKPGTSKEKQRELLEMSVVAQLWNGLIRSKQKPSRFLGRRSLRLAWEDLDAASKLPATEDTTILDRQVQWIEEFERLLFHQQDPDSNIDDDSALLWDADGGTAELAKRRERRQTAATNRVEETPS